MPITFCNYLGTLPRVSDISPIMGSDPEFFFKFKGEIVGAEKFLPEKGLVRSSQSKFIIDGVQAELNPAPSYCRALHANEIAACFRLLDAELKKRKGFTADFSRTVEISKANLDELDEKSKKFGCAPSKSIYKQLTGLMLKKVNPEEYLTRAAGGHIHIGKGHSLSVESALTKDYEKTVELLDILCGNTCVLVDRDKGNIERRKLYGKAGEYRLPIHGLEYRTLSNFWLTSYPLMSLAFGMVRLAVQLMSDEKNYKDYYKEFTSKVETKAIHTAINQNDYPLALENFKAIEKLILQVAAPTDRFPINSLNIKEFHYFHEMVEKNGLQHWFKQDPLEHWVTLPEAHRMGFHDYLITPVREEMAKNKKKAA